MDQNRHDGEPRRRGTAWLAATAATAGLVLCLASLLISGERLAGTGTHSWRGFPRPYLFAWEDAARENARSGFNTFYLIQNWLLWTAAAAAALLLLRCIRSRQASRD
ncbi:MAG TPA: hypothetical protein VF613_11785 [Longimicrobium sp.]